jgi:hypothetical protein
VTVDSFPLNFKLKEAIQENKRILEENKKLEAQTKIEDKPKNASHLNRTFSSNRNHISDPKAFNKLNFRSTRYNTEHFNEIPETFHSPVLPTIQTRQKTEYLKIPIISKKVFMLSLLYCVPALILVVFI